MMHRILLPAVALGCASLFTACQALPQLTEPVAIFYTPEMTQGVVADSDELRLKNIRLSPWLSAIPDCLDCRVTSRVDDRPSGPSHQVSLSQAEKIYWAFVNGKTTPYQTDIGRFSFVDQQLYVQTDPAQAAVKLTDSLIVADCHYQLLWQAQPRASAMAANISDERPFVHFQVLYRCN
ncbi:hypothetical protein [Reinekea forsetii]|nr:hypothetical protein [Reinekea forsetii]